LFPSSSVDLNGNTDDWVRFGFINFSRALSYETDVITLKSSACFDVSNKCQFSQLIPKSGQITVTSGTLHFKGKDPQPFKKSQQIDIKKVLRIYTSSDNLSPKSTYWIIYVDDAHEHDLVKITNASIKDDFIFNLKLPTGLSARDIQIQINSVKDFTACFFVQECPTGK